MNELLLDPRLFPVSGHDLEELVILRGNDQWLTLERPRLDAAALSTLQSVHFDSRWLIAGIGNIPARTLSE